MEIMQNSRGMTLEVHTESTPLYHITDKGNIKNILGKGLIPSKEGDIEIGDNNGMGVYCIKSLDDMDYVMSLAGWLNGIEDTAVIKFIPTDNWYVCINEPAENDDDDECGYECPEDLPHYGYVVHPNAIPKENIVEVNSLMDILHASGIQYP